MSFREAMPLEPPTMQGLCPGTPLGGLSFPRPPVPPHFQILATPLSRPLFHYHTARYKAIASYVYFSRQRTDSL